MSNAFLPINTNFTDMEKRERPVIGNWVMVECPACKGYGGYVLRVDAYGKGKHFQGHCMQCNGWGWVKNDSKDATCVHDYSNQKTVGNCLHEWKCVKCGHSIEVDSSG